MRLWILFRNVCDDSLSPYYIAVRCVASRFLSAFGMWCQDDNVVQSKEIRVKWLVDSLLVCKYFSMELKSFKFIQLKRCAPIAVTYFSLLSLFRAPTG